MPLQQRKVETKGNCFEDYLLFYCMKSTVLELQTLIQEWLPALQSVPEDELSFKPSPSKWSKKEIIGHLVDSAQNNIRRLIVAQYEDQPKITYNQDWWVAASGYQKYNLQELIQLWWGLNIQLSNIMQNLPDEMGQRQCQTEALHSLEWLASDYIKHLKHHMHQVLNLEPVAYP
jgi:hypothetical protein